MTEDFQTLPFYFRELSQINKYVLTNQAGSIQILNDRNDLEALINNRILNIDEQLREDLLAKSFYFGKP